MKKPKKTRYETGRDSADESIKRGIDPIVMIDEALDGEGLGDFAKGWIKQCIEAIEKKRER